MTSSAEPSAYDPGRANIARVYDYLLGGKDNFAADRALADELLTQQPEIRRNARENRAFMQRAVRAIAAEGVGQFLDIGTGLPTGYNVHEAARSVNPAARVVYVDNDEVVAAHARALLASETGVEFVLADLLEPADALTRAAETLDLSQPVALLIISMLHFVPDDSQACAVIGAMTDPLVPGSYLAVSHWQYRPADDEELTKRYASAVHSLARREEAQIAGLLPVGWQMLEPGLVPVPAWRPVVAGRSRVQDIAFLGAVLRKP